MDAGFSKDLKTDINIFKELKKDVQIIKGKYVKNEWTNKEWHQTKENIRKKNRIEILELKGTITKLKIHRMSSRATWHGRGRKPWTWRSTNSNFPTQRTEEKRRKKVKTPQRSVG